MVRTGKQGWRGEESERDADRKYTISQSFFFFLCDFFFCRNLTEIMFFFF